jgi:hypothetical protein
MDKLKVQEATKDLKVFFEKRKVKISEAKEIMFRLLDYIDTHYDEDAREVPFKNGNGLNGNIQPVSSKGLPLYNSKPNSSLQTIIKREPLPLYNKTGGKHR